MPLVQASPLRNNQTGSGPDGQAMEYFGSVTVNGTSPQTIADTRVTAGDIILFGLLTVGGTVGAIPTVKTITTGVGFTVAATASDTSVYNYQGYTPAAQQTA